MQRSRRALLQRRALISGQKNRFYKVSLSLVFISWSVLLFSSLWISRGDGFPGGGGGGGDSSESPSPDASTLGQRKLGCEETGSSLAEVLFGAASALSSDDALSTKSIVNGGTKEVPDLVSESGMSTESRVPVSDRLSRTIPIALEDFKSRAFSSKSNSEPGQTGGVIHRVEPGGQEYNYASSAKGAKVLGFNNEAKGASNILGRDKDKYLRNPCSAEGKFVVIELSEETLVDTIVVANFEHYSSNLKDFELLGSLVYPTDDWIKLGNFTAANVKQTQPFSLQEPQWVRYLRLNLVSHYGSEFYCTLSLIEVYGVDAVELMLEDLISVQDKPLVVEESSGDTKLPSSQSKSGQGDNLHDSNEKMGTESLPVNLSVKREVLKPKVPDPIEEIRYQVGRMPGDTAMKILMQKVRSLDLSLSVLEQYMEVINSRYGDIFKELDNDLGEKHALIEKVRHDFDQLRESHNVMAKDVDNLVSWKSHVSSQLDSLAKDHSVLRSSVLQVRANQISMENKNILIFVICLCFGILALIKLLVDMLLGVFSAFSTERTEESCKKFCSIRSCWSLLLVSCSIIILIMSL